MGRVNKKKLAEYTDTAENGAKKYNNDAGDLKKSADSDSADDDPLTNWNSKNDASEKKRTHSPDEAAPAESKKTAALPRKRKASAAASTSIEAEVDSAGRDSDGDDNDVEAPVNGKDVKKARKSNKGKVPVKVKGVAAGSVNKGGKQGKKYSKAKEIALNTNNDDSNDEPSEEDEEYEVEKIVGFKVVQNVNYYQVRWKGYGKADDTWEPEDTLSCPDLIAEFNQKVASVVGKQAKKGGNKLNKSNTGRKSTAVGGKKSDAAGEQDPNKEWEVEKIVDAVEDSSGRLFRIRWKGFSAKYDTWEPENNLSCNDLIAKFSKRLDNLKNIEVKNLREDPKKTQRLVNETVPRTNYHNKIGRSSKRSVTKQRVFYGED